MATRADFIIDQGSTFSTTIDISQDDGTLFQLDSYPPRARLAKSYSSGSQIDFTCSVNENSPNQDTIALSLTAAQTAAIKAGTYVYDVEIVSGAIITRVLEGEVTVTPSLYNFSSSNGIGDESPAL